MSRQQSLLPLSREPSTRLLPWIIGVMVYLAVLIFAGALVLASIAANWNREMTSGFTVQVPPVEGDAPEAMEARVAAAKKALEDTAGVAGVVVVSPETTALSLEPWLGPNIEAHDLPLPRVIEVRFAEQASVDMAALADRLEQAAPGSVVDSHEFWRNQIVSLVGGLEMLALVAIALIGFTAMAAVVFTTRSSVSIQRDVIEVLHLIGATDDYVAHEFQRQAFWISLSGSACGTVLAVGTLYLLGEIAGNLDTALMPNLTLGGWQSAVLWAVPVVACLIATMTARRTVLAALRRMP
jgi:cell division transport system permease protein